MKTRFYYTFCLTLACLSGWAQPGALDPDFGESGYFFTTFSNNLEARAQQVVVQPDDKIIVGATIGPVEAGDYVVLARYLPDGNIDSTFSGDGKVVIPEQDRKIVLVDVLLLPDGKILAGVNFILTRRTGFFRFNADGSSDDGFGIHGKLETVHAELINTEYAAMELQPDGKIVAAGYARADAFSDFLAVFRYLPNGQPDFTLNGSGIAPIPTSASGALIWEIIVQPDSKIVVAGSSNGETMVARLNPEGIPDPDFSLDGVAAFSISNPVFVDGATGLALLPDGKILVSVYARHPFSTGLNFVLMRLKPNGTRDDGFGDNGLVITDFNSADDAARRLLLQPDGKIVLAGYSRDANQQFAVARYLPGGMPDADFGENGKMVYPLQVMHAVIYGIAQQSDGKIILAGTVTPFNVPASVAVARIFSENVVGTHSMESPFEKIRIFPNPLEEQATLEYTLLTSSSTTILLYDLQGRLVQNLRPARLCPAGTHVEPLHFSPSLASGVYVLVIETGTERKRIKIVVSAGK